MKSLLALNHYFLKYKKLLFWGILFVVLSNLFTVALPYLVRESIDIISLNFKLLNTFDGSNALILFKSDLLKKVLWLIVLIILSAIIKGIFMFYMRQTIIVMSRKIEFDLKNEIFKHYLNLSHHFYRANFTGDLMNRISDDVNKVRMYLGPVIMYFINLLFTFIFVISMMLMVNVKLSLIVLAPLPFLSILIFLISQKINKKSDLIQEKLSDITSLAQETFSGIRIIKSYNSEKNINSIMLEKSNEYKTLKLSLSKIESFFNPTLMLLVSLSTILAIYFGGKGLINNEFTYGNIAEFVIYVNLLTWPVASLGWITSLVQRAAASQSRINEFLNQKSDIKNDHHLSPKWNSEIKFENISVKYPNKNENALTDLNLNLKKGEIIGVKGKTGTGKTSFLYLLMRLIEPDKGKISLDNLSIDQYNLNEYRQLFGYVPQDVYLFSDTILNNITFGCNPIPNLETIEKYAKIACIHDEIMSFKEGYQTIVGERGVTLSGGQKQRIAIVRALIKNPEIILFDDCLSAVDIATENIILNHLKNELKDKTSIIISHKNETFEMCDEVINFQ